MGTLQDFVQSPQVRVLGLHQGRRIGIPIAKQPETDFSELVELALRYGLFRGARPSRAYVKELLKTVVSKSGIEVRKEKALMVPPFPIPYPSFFGLPQGH